MSESDSVVPASPSPPSPVPARPPGPPGAAARVGLALALTAAGVTTIGPIAVGIAMVLDFVLVVLAAVALQHTGGFKVAHFGLAMWGGIAVTVTAATSLGAAPTRRKSAAAAEGADTPPAGRRRPVLATAVGLAILAPLIVMAEWGGNPWLPDALSAALIMAALYFFGIAILVSLLLMSLRMLRAIYGWGSRGGYRAGLLTGVGLMLSLPIPVSLLTTRDSRTGVAAQPDAISEKVEYALADVQRTPTFAAKNQRLLAYVASAVPPLRSSASSARFPRKLAAANRPLAALPALRGDDDDDGAVAGLIDALRAPPRSAVEDCFDELTRRAQDGQIPYDKALDAMRRLVQEAIAGDVVHSALLATCVEFGKKTSDERPRSLAAYFHKIVRHELANYFRKGRRATCDDSLDEEPERCTRPADEEALLREIGEVANAAYCRLDEQSRQLIDAKLEPGSRFRAIGAELGLSESQARARYNYAIGKLEKAVRAACPHE